MAGDWTLRLKSTKVCLGRIIFLFHGIISSPFCPSSKESFKRIGCCRVSIKRIYQSYRVIFRVALLPSEFLPLIPHPTVFGISYLISGQIIFEDSCYLRAFVKSSKWTVSWKSSCWFDCYCNITVLLGLKAANGFWISLLYLPVSCYNVSSF